MLATYLAGEVGTSAKISPVEYLKQLNLLTDSKIDVKVLSAVLSEMLRSEDTSKPIKINEIPASVENVLNSILNR